MRHTISIKETMLKEQTIRSKRLLKQQIPGRFFFVCDFETNLSLTQTNTMDGRTQTKILKLEEEIKEGLEEKCHLKRKASK